MTRRILVLGAVLALVAALTVEVTAGEKILVLKDGRRIQGEVTKTPDGYAVKTVGGTAVFAADQVARIEEVVTPADELKKRLDEIDTNDPDALYDVAKWATDKNLLAEARNLLKQVLSIKPDHSQARLRLKIVEARLARQPATVGPKLPTTRPPIVKLPVMDKSDLLTNEDIYRIRLKELQEDDRVAIEFRNKVLSRFVEAMRGLGIFATPEGERQFHKAPRLKQVWYMLDNTDESDRAIRDDILVKTDPRVMREFRTRIWPIVVANCASPSCHGGAKGAGGFKIYNVPQTDDRISYTNFYILQAWSRGGHRLIDRENSKKSLLLQHGLPQKLASHPHPKRIDVAYRSQKDRNYKLVEDWIKDLRYPLLPPGYRIQYKLPSAPQETTTSSPSIFD